MLVVIRFVDTEKNPRVLIIDVFSQSGVSLWLRPFTMLSGSPSLSTSPCLHSSLHPLLPSSPCWLGPSVAPAWIAARPRSSCHCCAACAGHPPAWWDAARPVIRPGHPLCTLPGRPPGWAAEECGSRRAPDTGQGKGGWRQKRVHSSFHNVICHCCRNNK